jgi:ABC-type Fe3+ transport system permease subunit
MTARPLQFCSRWLILCLLPLFLLVAITHFGWLLITEALGELMHQLRRAAGWED